MLAQLINTLLGVWLMAASAVLGYGGGARTNEQIVGPVIATFACCAIWQATRPLRWVNLPLGLWLAAAPFILGGYEREAMLNGILTGLAVAALSCVRGRRTKRFGGGWSALWKKPAFSTAA